MESRDDPAPSHRTWKTLRVSHSYHSPCYWKGTSEAETKHPRSVSSINNQPRGGIFSWPTGGKIGWPLTSASKFTKLKLMVIFSISVRCPGGLRPSYPKPPNYYLTHFAPPVQPARERPS